MRRCQAMFTSSAIRDLQVERRRADEQTALLAKSRRRPERKSSGKCRSGRGARSSASFKRGDYRQSAFSAQKTSRTSCRGSQMAAVGISFRTVIGYDPGWTKGLRMVEPFALTERRRGSSASVRATRRGAIAALLVAYAWLAERTDLWQGANLADRRCRLGRLRTERRRLSAGAAAGSHRRCVDGGEGPGGMGLAIRRRAWAWFRIKVQGKPGREWRRGAATRRFTRPAAMVTIHDQWNERLAEAPGDLGRPDRDAARDGCGSRPMSGRVSGGSFFSWSAGRPSRGGARYTGATGNFRRRCRAESIGACRRAIGLRSTGSRAGIRIGRRSIPSSSRSSEFGGCLRARASRPRWWSGSPPAMLHAGGRAGVQAACSARSHCWLPVSMILSIARISSTAPRFMRSPLSTISEVTGSPVS